MLLLIQPLDRTIRQNRSPNALLDCLCYSRRMQKETLTENPLSYYFNVEWHRVAAEFPRRYSPWYRKVQSVHGIILNVQSRVSYEVSEQSSEGMFQRTTATAETYTRGSISFCDSRVHSFFFASYTSTDF